jgi:hypothetical protein
MKRKDIGSVIVVSFFLVILGYVKKIHLLMYAGIVIGILGILWRGFGETLHVLWMKLGELLGAITSRIILFLLFFLVLVPVSFFAKRSGKLSMQIKPDGNSYYKQSDHLYTKHDLENPW